WYPGSKGRLRAALLLFGQELALGGDCAEADLQRQVAEQLAELRVVLGVDEPALRVEPLLRVADRDLSLDDPRTRDAEHLAEIRLRPDAAEGAGGRADHGDGLVPERRLAARPRCPVDGVLEHARDGAVV